ncbi:hypothetical protein HG15A2_15200 [Adhaeretor mobilis]|uniref:Uncharacterized protein n=1 Tax=Adhaeretor mobilis TaxID=1930276 RepID=A0A517MU01_9BACT|nr:hypothetical protein HG15A2_15200 [Adhaeretor mobilis]
MFRSNSYYYKSIKKKRLRPGRTPGLSRQCCNTIFGIPLDTAGQRLSSTTQECDATEAQEQQGARLRDASDEDIVD